MEAGDRLQIALSNLLITYEKKNQAVRLGATTAIQPGIVTAPREKLQILDVQWSWSQFYHYDG